jgi:uncharacterized protein YdaU (DUF1376 family)
MATKPKEDRLAWFKHDPAKFNLDTAGLSNQAAGIYIKLMNLYWMNQLKLPPLKSTWIRQLGIVTDSEHEDLEQLLTELDLKTEDEGYTIPDLVRQLEDIRGYSSEQSKRATDRHRKEREEKEVSEEEFVNDAKYF